MMWYRHKDGTYTVSSFDAEWWKTLTRTEGNVHVRGLVRDGHLTEEQSHQIMDGEFEGFIPSRTVECV